MCSMFSKAALSGALLALAACTDTPAPVVAAAPPPVAVAAPTAPVDPNRALPIFFEPWSAALDDSSRMALGEAAERIKANPRVPVLVIGFADPRGSREANTMLSRLRARIVADELIGNGVPTARVRILYRGPTPGFASVESRRVEVRVDRGQR